VRSMQDKILGLIEDTVRSVTRHRGNYTDTAAYEVVQRADYANAGTLYVQPVGEHETALTIGYDFQSRSATFTLGHADHLPEQLLVEGRLWIRADKDRDGSETRVFSFGYIEHDHIDALLGSILDSLLADLKDRGWAA
jgi:hypothetical protein